MRAIRIVRRGTRNSRVLWSDGTTSLVENTQLSSLFTTFASSVVESPRNFDFKFGFEIECLIPYDKKQNVVDEMKRAFGPFGVVENWDRYGRSRTDAWVCGYDSSVSGSNFFGAEITSPILTETTLWELEKVYEILTRNGARVNRTCGAHVHFSGFGTSIEDARKVKTFYRSNERYIDNLVANSRRASNVHYAQPISIRSCDDTKYEKLSIRYFQRNATIENRQHQGTLNFGKMRAWVIFNKHFIQAVLTGKNFEAVNTTADLLQLLELPVDVHTYLLERVEELSSN